MYTKLDQLPAESLTHILGYLDIKTLAKLNRVNRTFYGMVTYFLLNPKNPFALSFLKTWAEFISSDNDLKLLPEHLDLVLQSMEDPELQIENKITCLAMFANYKNRKLTISELHFKELFRYLSPDKEKYILPTLEILSCLYPHFTPDQSLMVLMDTFNRVISNCDSNIYNAAIKILGLMIPTIPLSQFNMLFEELANNLNDKNFQLKKTIFEIAAFMGPRLTSEQITIIFPLIEKTIGNKNSRKCDAAHRAVSGMATGFSDKQRMTILKNMMPKDKQPTQSMEVRTAFCNLTKNLGEKHRITILKILLKGLQHKKELMRASSIESLSAILSSLNRDQKNVVIEKLTVLLDDEDEVIRTSALITLPEIVQFLKLEQLKNIMARIANLLTDKISNSRFNALETLESLGTQLSLDSIESILPLVLIRLNEEDRLNNQSKAIDVLTALAPKLSSKWIRPVFKSVIQFLSSYHLDIPAMKTLAALGSQLNNQQTNLVFEELITRVYLCDVARTTLVVILPQLNDKKRHSLLTQIKRDLEDSPILILRDVLIVLKIIMPLFNQEETTPLLLLATQYLDHDNGDIKEETLQLLISAKTCFPQKDFNFVAEKAFSMLCEKNHNLSHYALQFLQKNISLLGAEQQSFVMYVLLYQLYNSDVNFKKKYLSLSSAAIASKQLSIDKMDNDLNSPHLTLLRIFSEWHNYIHSLQTSQQSLILSSLGHKFFDRRPPSNGKKEDESNLKTFKQVFN